jgi:peptide/nickel transport system ATP-binding protein
VSLLEVHDLCKSYRVKKASSAVAETISAVRNVSFAIEPGETFALVGESGAGKSTTGRLVLRLIEPDSGTVMFNQVDVLDLDRSDLRALRRDMQMIFQNPYSSLDPRLPIGISIGEPMLVHFRASAAERRERAAELIDRVGLDKRIFDRLPGELSGGQLQRVSIARALSIHPKLIVCDEPVAALDVSMRAQVINLMMDLQREFGLTYLFISHDLSLVEAIADSVGVMFDGAIIETGSVEKIFDAPQEQYTKELIAAIPTGISRLLHSDGAHGTDLRGSGSTPSGSMPPPEPRGPSPLD